jgi:hypothetical protein
MASVGITATREGLTSKQRWRLEILLMQLSPDEAHHGDCVGGDAEFHEMCLDLSIPVWIHPPVDNKYRAWCKSAAGIASGLPYLDRNKVIVNSVDYMFACPKEDIEPRPARGQGTWSTIRYARRMSVPMKIIWPGGRVQEVR